MSQIAKENGVHQTLVRNWKQQYEPELRNEALNFFQSEYASTDDDPDSGVNEIYDHTGKTNLKTL